MAVDILATMRRLLIAAGVLAVIAAAGYQLGLRPTPAVQAETPRTDIAQQLRYIGRDTATGMPVPVDDRFIAESERAIERYGLDAGKAVPPPPVAGTDIVSI